MIDTKYLDAIKRFEGFTPRAQWDYAQSSNGYGTRALHEGEVIDRAEADRRFKAEIKAAYDVVERFAPHLDEGSKAALTSLTYNAGPSWTTAGLGNAVRSGDLEAVKSIFQQYTKAGGQSLPGLEQRRTAEAAWFQNLNSAPQSTNEILASAAAGPSATGIAHIPEMAFTRPAATTASKPASQSTKAQFPESILEPANPDLKNAAALTLAKILSILSLSHIEQRSTDAAAESRDNDRELFNATKRGSQILT